MSKKDETPKLPDVRDPSTAIPPDVLPRYVDPIPAGTPQVAPVDEGDQKK